MPAPFILQDSTNATLESQRLFTLNKSNMALSAFNTMLNYNPIGSGQLNYYDWNAPSGDKFTYYSGNSEILLNDTQYSSLVADQKLIFFKWLNQFSKAFVIQYNKEFGI